jgi:hypothetical protein
MHHTSNLYYFKNYLQDRIIDLSITNLLLLKVTHLHLNINADWIFEDFHRLFSINPHVKHFNLILDNINESMTEASS